MRRICIAALFMVLLAGCGGGGNSTEVFQPTDPLASGMYISITARSDITKYLGQWALGGNGFIVVSKPRGPQGCSYRGKITEAEIHYKTPASVASHLSKYVGQDFTIALSGTNAQIPGSCKALQAGMKRLGGGG